MPLTPATTDKFMKVGNPGTATTLSAPGYTTGVSTSITVGATTNWPTDTLTAFAMDSVTVVAGVAVRVAGSYCEFTGIVTGANTIASMVLAFGTAQNYAAGALTRVYIPVSSTRENALVDGLAQDHNLKGNHKTLTDDNGNEWLERGSVASAVNHVKATNAVTGGAARLDGAGDDALVDLYLGGKGGGVAHIENPELISNFVASGGVVAISSGLISTFSNIVYYIAGKRYKKSTVANKTYTASKDTYVDIDTAGTVTYTEVVNGAAAPALAASSIRLAKVVTSGAAITSIAQTGVDSLGNKFYNKSFDVNSPTPVFRQGGNATNWTTRGTTNYDIRSVQPIMQFGSVAVTSVDMFVTFPVPHSQMPVVIVTTSSASSYNVFSTVSGVGLTGFNVRTINDTGAGVITEGINWIAIGV